MITISAKQVTAIVDAARPLLPQERKHFLGEVAEALLNWRGEYAIGDGELSRLLAELQRRYFKPPTETEDTRQGARRAFERG